MHDSILETIRPSPAIRLRRTATATACPVYVRSEHAMPTGSSMDEVAIAIVTEAERHGRLAPGGTIIEGGNGNLGMALALVAAARGYRLTYVTDDRQSQEKVATMRAFGADIVVCPAAVKPEDPRSKHSVAQRLSEETPGCYYPRFHASLDSVEHHYRKTGPELLEATEGRLTHVFVGVGSGATIAGVGRFLRERQPGVKVVGVDPEGSVAAELFRTKRVSLEGERSIRSEELGSEVPPPLFDGSVIDEIVTVSDREALRMSHALARREGILTGLDGGAIVAAGLRWLTAHPPAPNALAVCVLPDDGRRYLSTVHSDQWQREQGLATESLELTASDILERKGGACATPRLLAVAPHSLLLEAVELFKRYGISQIPVLEGDVVVGALKEDRVVELLLSGPDAKTRTVREIMDSPFPVVDAATKIGRISRLIDRDNPAVLVRRAGVYEILTKMDLIRAIAS